jgi:hypothetical protein
LGGSACTALAAAIKGDDLWHGHRPQDHQVLLGPPGDLGVEFTDLRRQMEAGANRRLRRGNGTGGQTLCGSSTLAMSLPAFAAPCGTIRLNWPG